MVGPKVFLSFASEDEDLAAEIARKLQGTGIDTWWSQWCIRAGDSIRQRIDEGLAECTHFIVLLTPQSIGKPWVNAEIDAGLIRKLGDESVHFIPLRSGLPASALSPLLQARYSPELHPQNLDLAQLINDIHGVTRKPPLGPAPSALLIATAARTGFSPSATALAALFVTRSKHGKPMDPVFNLPELAVELKLSEEDAKDAIFELGGYVKNHRDHVISPEDTLFMDFDRFWQPWDPEKDALTVAAGLINDPNFPREQEPLAQYLGWSARRLNPAVTYLARHDLIKFTISYRGDPWHYACMFKSDATRRFVKSRS